MPDVDDTLTAVDSTFNSFFVLFGLKDGAAELVGGKIEVLKAAIRPVVDDVGVVHFAQFVLLKDVLIISTAFDGNFDIYLRDVTDQLANIFDLIIPLVTNAPPYLSRSYSVGDVLVEEDLVENNRAEFRQYIRQNYVDNWDRKTLYSNYGEAHSALEIREKFGRLPQRPQLPTTPRARVISEDDLADIQGLIARGYRLPYVRHLLLRISDAEMAKQLIGGLATGTNDAGFEIRTAEQWDEPPDHCLNIGFTYQGLVALRLDPEFIDALPGDFAKGAYESTVFAQDPDAEKPKPPTNWTADLDTDKVHIFLTLHAKDETERDARSSKLEAMCEASGLRKLHPLDGQLLRDDQGNPTNREHFGFADGLSQPAIEGLVQAGVPRKVANYQPEIPAGDILIGYDGTLAPESAKKGAFLESVAKNSSYAAFVIAEQDVDGFNTFIDTKSAEHGLDAELLAAKICGRWRNGNPLVLAPNNPGSEMDNDRINQFDYVAPASVACPVASHIRRTNPRSQLVAGGPGRGHSRRLIRRGRPYVDPSGNRGLLGMFICGSLHTQFEFIMRSWVQGSLFTPGIRGCQDPWIGNFAEDEGKFIIEREGAESIKISGFSNFVTMRGAAYLMLPSISMLKNITVSQSE